RSVVDDLARVLRDARDAPELGLGDDRLRAGGVPRRRYNVDAPDEDELVVGDPAVLAGVRHHARILVRRRPRVQAYPSPAGRPPQSAGTLWEPPGAVCALDGGGSGDDRKLGAQDDSSRRRSP